MLGNGKVWKINDDHENDHGRNEDDFYRNDEMQIEETVKV